MNDESSTPVNGNAVAAVAGGANIWNPLVGRTHTIVRLQTRIRPKDGTENFGGFVFVLDLV